MPVICLENVKKVYPMGKVSVEAVKNASFVIEKGEFVSITGPSGSGKTTILNMIGLIDTPTEGSIIVNGEVMYDKKHYERQAKKKMLTVKQDDRITQIRHDTIGFIFQNFNLVPVLNVAENVAFPLLLGSKGKITKENREWADYLIEKVGLTAWKHHKPNELSGGQRQRTAIARALATKAPVILADEPTANLDSKTGAQILTLMHELNSTLGTTFIFSTHDKTIVESAGHVIRLLDGEIIENTVRSISASNVQ